MILTASILVLALLGVLFLIAALRSLRLRRMGSGAFKGITSLVLFLIAIVASLGAMGLRSYQRLGSEQEAGELEFKRLGYHQFNGVLLPAGGERMDFALRGDEWQVDARVLKFQAFADVLGFDALYRLERISGRYTSIEDERNLPRTVFAITPADRVDLWSLVHRYQTWMPWVDAMYGSATFLPMAEGARYEITVSQTGLLARPLNQAARDAVGLWH